MLDEDQELAKLQEWVDRKGELPQFMSLYRRLLSIQLKANVRLSTGHLPSQERVAERQRQGIPCLQFDDISWDETLLQELFREIVGILVEHQVASFDEASALINAADEPSFLPATARSLYEQGVVPEDKKDGVDQALLRTATQAAMWPFLARYSKGLSPFINQESWARGTCPICGGKPDFGFLKGEVGARWLICSRCDARWPFRRIGCPYCGTQDQDKLGYRASEHGLYRLYLCDQCHSYLKVVDLRKTEWEVLLPLERVLTLDMDRHAQEEGYHVDWEVREEV